MPEMETILSIFNTFMNSGMLETGFFICCCYCMLRGNEDFKKKMFIITVIMIICFGNTISYTVLSKVAESATYYRFFWMLPVLFVMAYTIVQAIGTEKNKLAKIFCIAILILFVFCSGQSYYSQELMRIPTNKYVIDDDIIVLSEALHEYDDRQSVKVALPIGLEYQYRSYDASVVYAISRKAYIYCLQEGFYTGNEKYAQEEVLIRAVYAGVQENAEALRETIVREEVDYLIVKNELNMDDYFVQAGCKLVETGTNYSLYDCNR